jgi:type I restriction enzyme M protein
VNQKLEKHSLGAAADQLRANSSLTAQQYSHPVLGLSFLKFADHRFTAVEKGFKDKKTGGRRTIGKLDYQAKGVIDEGIKLRGIGFERPVFEINWGLLGSRDELRNDIIHHFKMLLNLLRELLPEYFDEVQNSRYR